MFPHYNLKRHEQLAQKMCETENNLKLKDYREYLDLEDARQMFLTP